MSTREGLDGVPAGAAAASGHRPGATPAGTDQPGPAGQALATRSGELQFTITRLGPPPRRRRQLYLGAAAALALAALATGTTVVLARPAGHVLHRAAPPPAPMSSAVPVQSAGPAPSASPMSPGSPAHRSRHAAPPAATTQLAGIGCPAGPASITLMAAAMGPAWTSAGGGWTGGGCNGSSAWTMATPGDHAAPSSLTWSFHPGTGATRCALAVFVPTQNALGLGEYVISSSAGQLATVPVYQAGRAGQWVPLGSYPVAGTAVDIQLVPAGATLTAAGPPGHGHNSAVAASAAQATCS